MKCKVADCEPTIRADPERPRLLSPLATFLLADRDVKFRPFNIALSSGYPRRYENDLAHRVSARSVFHGSVQHCHRKVQRGRTKAEPVVMRSLGSVLLVAAAVVALPSLGIRKGVLLAHPRISTDLPSGSVGKLSDIVAGRGSHDSPDNRRRSLDPPNSPPRPQKRSPPKTARLGDFLTKNRNRELEAVLESLNEKVRNLEAQQRQEYEKCRRWVIYDMVFSDAAICRRQRLTGVASRQSQVQ